MPAKSIYENQWEPCSQAVYFNGKIYSLTHPQESPEEAMLIEKNRILALGSSAEIFSLAKKEAKRIDLMGGCVLPGFQDSHCHLLHTAIFETELDVHSASSPEEIIHMGREYIQEKKIPAGTVDPHYRLRSKPISRTGFARRFSGKCHFRPASYPVGTDLRPCRSRKPAGSFPFRHHTGNPHTGRLRRCGSRRQADRRPPGKRFGRRKRLYPKTYA